MGSVGVVGPALALEEWVEVLGHIWKQLVVELLHQSAVDQAGSHPVGEAEGVGASVLTGRKLVLDAGVVSVVVVNVDVVLDLNTGLLFEALDGWRLGVVVVVHVVGPVVPGHYLLTRGEVLGRGEVLCATGRAGSQGNRGCAEAGSGQNGAAGNSASGHRLEVAEQ